MIVDEATSVAWLKELPEGDAAAFAKLEHLGRLLADENQRQNLVSAESLHAVWRRHIVDSAQLLTYVSRGTSPWLDLGTGAGFPGIVIAALRPECEIIMVESRKRRVEWLNSLCTELGLGRAKVVAGRVEAVPSRAVAAISARAFAPLDRLLTLSARFSTADTIWVLPKGRSAQQDLQMLRGWNHDFHVEQSLTDPDAGVIVGTLQGQHSPGRKGKTS